MAGTDAGAGTQRPRSAPVPEFPDNPSFPDGSLLPPRRGAAADGRPGDEGPLHDRTERRGAGTDTRRDADPVGVGASSRRHPAGPDGVSIDDYRRILDGIDVI
jgi:hypothetical protein